MLPRREMELFNCPVDATIIFNNHIETAERFPVRSLRIASRSARLARELRDGPAEGLLIEEYWIPVAHFKAWLLMCSAEEDPRTLANAYDLLYLSKKYEAFGLEKFLLKLINDAGDDMTIPEILWILKRGDSAAPEEQKLRENFARFLGRSDLLDLPLNALHRIVQRLPRLTIADPALKNFLKRAFEKWHGDASKLAAAVDWSGMTPDAIRAEFPDLQESGLQDALGQSALNLKMRIQELQRRVQTRT